MKFLKKVDLILVLLISLFSLIIGVIDFFDWFTNVEVFQKIDKPLLILLLLGIFGLHFVLRYINEEENNIKKLNSLELLIQSSDNIKVNKFKNSFDIETYLAKRVYEATVEVCDLTWKNSISSSYDVGKRKQSRNLFEKALADHSKNLIYREIFIFNDNRRIAKLESRIKENRDGYSCRYYRDSKNNIPRLQFVIIDNEEVLFFSSADNSLLCSIKGENICGVFKPYFEQVWKNATPIKEGKKIYQEELKFINDTYKD